MAKKSKNAKPNDEEQHPANISIEDWKITPVSVRKFIAALLDNKKPKNHLPGWVIVLLNILIVATLAYFFEDFFISSCVTPPYISSLTAVILLFGIGHLLWRYIYPTMRRGSHKGDFVNISLGGLKFDVDRNIIFAILNEIHPWKISGRILGFALLIISIVGLFLNMSPFSPFYSGGEPFLIQGFAVQRLSSLSPEILSSGETLTMTTGEKVILEVVVLGETQVSCIWFIATGNQNTSTGCSIAYGSLSPGMRDNLSVFVKPGCGSRQESANLNIFVQP